jgi:hypothetical protein
MYAISAIHHISGFQLLIGLLDLIKKILEILNCEDFLIIAGLVLK